MSNVFDDGELKEINIVKLKSRRTRLKMAKLQLKQGQTVMSVPLREQLDKLNSEIRQISETIYRLTGERE
jgi:glycine cleavage system regulatory protein